MPGRLTCICLRIDKCVSGDAVSLADQTSHGVLFEPQSCRLTRHAALSTYSRQRQALHGENGCECIEGAR